MDNKITNQKELLEYFDKTYGTELSRILSNLYDESEELNEACYDYMFTNTDMIDLKLAHMKDEACDVYSVILHFLHCLGLTPEDAVASVIDKIEGRKIDKDYKRFKELEK